VGGKVIAFRKSIFGTDLHRSTAVMLVFPAPGRGHADKDPSTVRIRSTRPDIASLGGLLVAAAALLGGLIMDGGKISDVTQITAAIIVLGGTLGP